MLKLDPGACPSCWPTSGSRWSRGPTARPRPRTSWPRPYAPRSVRRTRGRLVHNADGANLHHGIASALSEQPEAEIAILETDERVVADMIRLGRPEVLVLLNFSRDQLDRHHEIKGSAGAGGTRWPPPARTARSWSPTPTSR